MSLLVWPSLSASLLFSLPSHVRTAPYCRSAAVASAYLLLKSTRRFLGDEVVGLCLDALASLCWKGTRDDAQCDPRAVSHDPKDAGSTSAAATSTQECTDDLVSGMALDAVQRLRSSLPPAEWREMWDRASHRLQSALSELKVYARSSGSGAREATAIDRLRLIGGLAELLAKDTYLPTAAMLDAVAGLLVVDSAVPGSNDSGGSRTGAAVSAVLVSRSFGSVGKDVEASYYRRPLAFLRSSEASKTAREVLQLIGRLALRRSELADLLVHVHSEAAAASAQSAAEASDYSLFSVSSSHSEVWATRGLGCNRTSCLFEALAEVMIGAHHERAVSSDVDSLNDLGVTTACRDLTLLAISDGIWGGICEAEDEAVAKRTGASSDIGLSGRAKHDLMLDAASSTMLRRAASFHSWAEHRAWAVASRLEWMGSAAQLLGVDFEDGLLCMDALYPVLGKIAEANPIVAQAAGATARRFAAHSGLYTAAGGLQPDATMGPANENTQQLGELLRENLDYVVDPLLEDLRGGVNGSLRVLELLLRLSGASASAPLLRDVLSSILVEVDAAAKDPSSSTDTVISLLRAVSTLISAVSEEERDLNTSSGEARGAEEIHDYLPSQADGLGKKTTTNPQFSHLFRLLSDVNTDTSEHTNDTGKLLDDTHGSCADEDGNERGASDGQDDEATAPDVQLVTDLLPRLGYWLAHGHDLRVRIASLTSLENAVQKLRSRPRLLLPAVHSLWPSLAASFRPKASSKTTTRIGRVEQASLSTLESALASAACDLITSLARVCGEFLTFKFDEDLWPSLESLLDQLSSLERRRMAVSNGDQSHARIAAEKKSRRHYLLLSGAPQFTPNTVPANNDDVHVRSDETRLRRSLFRCLAALASLPQCSRFMRPVAGRLTTLALPFLRLEDRWGLSVENTNDGVGAAARQLVSSLGHLDYSTVWHALWLGLTPAVAEAYATELGSRQMGPVRGFVFDAAPLYGARQFLKVGSARVGGSRMSPGSKSCVQATGQNSAETAVLEVIRKLDHSTESASVPAAVK